MRIGIWPFYSQQNKIKSTFQLMTCGAAKQAAFLERSFRNRGWSTVIAVPDYVKHPYSGAIERVSLPLLNPWQRVHWNTLDLARVFSNCDVCIANHELLAIPLRQMYPNKRIVQMCSVEPDSGLFFYAWDCADLVVMQGAFAAEWARNKTSSPVTSWKLAYDEAAFAGRIRNELLAVLFIQRCSANNYTHHEEFLASGVDATYVDVTRYLRKQRPDLKYIEPHEYMDALHSAKVAVALNDNLYGGLSIREALRAGCVPVVLNAPCYWELVGRDWPYMCDPTPSSICDAVNRALNHKGPLPPVNESYQAAEPGILRDLEELC